MSLQWFRGYQQGSDVGINHFSVLDLISHIESCVDLGMVEMGEELISCGMGTDREVYYQEQPFQG